MEKVDNTTSTSGVCGTFMRSQNRSRRFALTLVAVGVAGLAFDALILPARGADAKSADGRIEVEGAWARANGTRETSIYFDILNHGTKDDRLVAVSSRDGARCFLEQTSWHGLSIKTTRLDGIAVPAMSRVHLAPGGVFVDVTDLPSAPDQGTIFHLSLTFADAGPVDVAATFTSRLLGPPE